MGKHQGNQSSQSPEQKNIFHLEQWLLINVLLVLYDMIAVNAAYFLALWIRFDCRFNMMPERYWSAHLHFMPFYTIICIIVFTYFRLYQSIWRFASFVELTRTIAATTITGIIEIVGITAFCTRMPLTYYCLGILFQFTFVAGIRFAYRFVLLLRSYNAARGEEDGATNVMLIGGGSSGRIILRDILRSEELNDKVCCIIDDDKNKQGKSIDGVPIVGGRDDILENCKRYRIKKIYLAIPSASPEQKRDILNICKESGCQLKSLPGVFQLVNGEVTLAAMKQVAIEDLLGRDPIKVEMKEIFAFISGKRILVTGGGGSIGSELCRQIASHHPEQLIIFDIYENNAYEIEQELRRNLPDLNLVVLIGSVRDSRRIHQVFDTYKPDIVFHAAAHKHVPLMENSPNEAIKNNAIGTYKTAYEAMMNGCQRFVLISTDKAVNPTNIMGASKRLCEMIIQAFDAKIKENREEDMPILFTHKGGKVGKDVPFIIPGQDNEGHHSAQTEFVAVRFGNVLGSNGSVIPLFKKQILDGGPVTVTHPDIIRYFMTIPEAVSLVLQAGTYAKGGEIFVLDMADPVKIDDLARNLIKLSGFKPDVDIKIEYTGLRPGEKLFEEKLMAEEGLKKTENELIHIGCPIPFDVNLFLEQLDTLMGASMENSQKIIEMVEQVVSTYHPIKANVE